MLEKLKRRIRNKKVVAYLVTAILGMLLKLGVIDVAIVNQFETVSTFVLGLLVTLGILTDPEPKPKQPEQK